MTYPSRFHLVAATILALTATWSYAATATDELHSANTVRVDDSAFGSVNQEHQAHTYLPGQKPCPKDYSGAVVAVGCASVVWCFHGVTEFLTTCDEGELFDDTCLCCRSTEEYSCPTTLEQHLPQEEGKEVTSIITKTNAATGGAEVEQQEEGGDEMSFSFDDVSEVVGQPSCSQNHSGPVVALGCASVAWCQDGSITFSTTCNEGTLFDTSCLCCRNAQEYSCPTTFEQQPQEEKDNEVVEVDNVKSIQSNTETDDQKGEQQGDEAAMNFSYDEVTDAVVGGAQEEEEEEEEVYDTVVPDALGFDNDGSPPSTAYPSFLPSSLPTATVARPSTSPTSSKTPTAPSNVCPPDYTGLQSANVCMAYSVCNAGVLVVTVDCPAGTKFDDVYKKCVEGFVCAGDVSATSSSASPSEVSSASPSTLPSSSPTPEPSSTPSGTPIVVSTLLVPRGMCPRGYTGLAAIFECKSVNVCRDGKYSMTVDCPTGTLFDVRSGRCTQWSQDFVCGGGDDGDISIVGETDGASNEPSSGPADELAQEVVVCPPGYIGFVPTADCTGSVVCNNGTLFFGPIGCPGDTLFDSVNGFCTDPYEGFVCDSGITDPPSNAPSASPSRQPSAEPSAEVLCPPGYMGLAPAAGKDCTAYNVCNDGVVLLGPVPCPNGTLLDVSKPQCDYPSNEFVCGAITTETLSETSEEAPSRAPSTTPSTAPSETPKCPRGFTGLVPASETCKASIYCQGGVYKSGPVSCPGDSVFDFTRQSCITPSAEFSCNYYLTR